MAGSITNHKYKEEIWKRYAKQTNCTEAEAKEIITRVFYILQDVLVEKGQLFIRQLGKFIVREQPTKTGWCPKTESSTIRMGGKWVSFRTGVHLKRRLNNNENIYKH